MRGAGRPDPGIEIEIERPPAHPADGNGQGAPAPLVLARLADGAAGERRFALGGADGVAALEQLLGTARRNGHPAANGYAEPASDELIEQVRVHAPDDVYLVLDRHTDEAQAHALAAQLLMDGIAVHLIVVDLGAPPVRMTVGRLGPHACMSLAPIAEGRAGRALRRAVDVAGSALLLLVLAPLMAAVAAVVWWRMGSPVIYAQERVGRFGRRFPLYKFRSMVPDAERLLRASPEIYRRYVASNYKLPESEDPRITPLGRFLRRASLDELPQLWNVLRGDMALVGPRPVVPDEVAEYGGYGRMLLRVRPGLTGAWQVGGRSAIGYPERARIDLDYLAARSLAEDIGILLRTVPAVLRRRGAL